MSIMEVLSFRLRGEKSYGENKVQQQGELTLNRVLRRRMVQEAIVSALAVASPEKITHISRGLNA
jgi:hypothetical protein